MSIRAVVQRELTEALRAPSMGAALVTYLVLLSALLVFMWPQSEVFSQAAQSSRSLILSLALWQFLMVVLFVPAVGSGLVSREREQATLMVLLSSRLSSVRLMLGKLVSLILGGLLPLMLGLPIVLMCGPLGAVSLMETGRMYVVLASLVLLLASVSLTVSRLARTTRGALAMTFFVIGLLVLLPLLPSLILPGDTMLSPLSMRLRLFSPPVALISVLSPGWLSADPSSMPMMPGGLQVVLPALGLSVLLALWTVLWPLPEATGVCGRPRGESDPKRARSGFPFGRWTFLRGRGPIPDGLNPVFAKELRNGTYGGGVWFVRSAYLSFAASIALVVASSGRLGSQSPAVVIRLVMVFQTALLALLLPSLTAGAITQEIEDGSLDLLRQSGLRAGVFLRGKIMVALLFLGVLLLGSVPVWYAVWFLSLTTAENLLHAAVLLMLFSGFCLVAGLVGSALCRRTASAAVTGYALVAAVTLLNLPVLLLHASLSLSVREKILVWNPLLALLQLLMDSPLDQYGELWSGYMLGTGAVTLLGGLFVYGRVRRLLTVGN